jgi:enolase
MITIKKISAWTIFDSNGNPTLKGTLELSNDTKVSACVPSTFSDGKYEAFELRDNQNQKFNGKGVEKSCYYINHLISQKLTGVSPLKQKEIDYWLLEADNTENKGILGGNTTLLISTLILKAGAKINNLPLYRYINYRYQNYFNDKIEITSLPRPIFNLIDGGRHGLSVDFQEYYVFFPVANQLMDLYQQIFDFKNQLIEGLKKRSVSLSFGNFGGFAPNFRKNIDPLEILVETASYKNLINGVNYYLGVDFSANNFYHNDNYYLHDQPTMLSPNKYYEFIVKITKDYHLLFVEDIFSNTDINSWQNYYKGFSNEIYISGDDLVGGAKKRFEMAIKDKLINSVNLKPSQVGTITETLEIANLIKKSKSNLIIGTRNGETNDETIVDLSVALQANFVKFGALNRGERVNKYNRLLEIEKEITTSL